PRAPKSRPPRRAPLLRASSRAVPEIGQTVYGCATRASREAQGGEPDDQDPEHHTPSRPTRKEGSPAFVPERRRHSERLPLRQSVEPISQHVIHEKGNEEVVEQATLQSTCGGRHDVVPLPAHLPAPPQPTQQVKLVTALGQLEVIARE